MARKASQPPPRQHALHYRCGGRHRQEVAAGEVDGVPPIQQEQEICKALFDQRNPDIIIPHFATSGGNNSNYFFAIYRILMKLRVLLR